MGLPVSASTAEPCCLFDAGDDALAVRLNAALYTAASCWSVCRGLPSLGVPQPHILSNDAVTMNLPSGLKAALYTAAVAPNERRADGQAGHRRPTAAPSVRRPSEGRACRRADAALSTTSVMPYERFAILGRSWRPHSRTVLSNDAVTSAPRRG